jgi:F0F1-type ATP synthase membrane subunit b/b'
MSQEQILKEEKRAEEPQKEKKASPEDVLKTLNDIREQTGQISELATEENMLVKEFLTALLKIMKPLTRTLPITTTILPEEWGKVSQANVDLTGQLLVLYPNGRMRSINLAEQRHRELLHKIIYDVMPKLKKLIASHRQEIEARVKFMSSVTKELQNTARAFSQDYYEQSTS